MDCIKESILRIEYMEQELGKINLTISLKETGETGPSNTQAASETRSLDELAWTAGFLDAELTQTAETSALAWTAAEASFPDAGPSFLHAGPSLLDDAQTIERSFLDEIAAALEAGTFHISSFLND